MCDSHTNEYISLPTPETLKNNEELSITIIPSPLEKNEPSPSDHTLIPSPHESANPTLLFACQKFLLPVELTDYSQIKTLLEENGARLVESFQDNETFFLPSDFYYVVDSFDLNNKFFSMLTARGVNRIISPKCIYDSIHLNKPIPDIKFPRYARLMEQLTLCIPQCDEIEDEIITLVRYLGGEVEDDITDSTDYLITKKVGSIQYQIAQQHKNPILSTDWVRECWRSQSLVNINLYYLPPFAGCVISVTGLSPSTRDQIQRLSQSYGGEYTANLTKRCTHLLAKGPTGIKYRYALEWGVHCISVQWFFDSINLQVCADETQYYLPMSEASRQALFNPVATSPRDLSRLSPPLRKKHLMQLHKRYGGSRKSSPSKPYDFYVISSSNPNPLSGRRIVRSSMRSSLRQNSPIASLFVQSPPRESSTKNEFEMETDSETNSSASENVSQIFSNETINELHKLCNLCSKASALLRQNNNIAKKM